MTSPIPKFALILFFAMPLLVGAQQAENRCTISGYVVDADSQPVVGASVAILSAGEVLTGTATDNRGHFRITLAHNGTGLQIRVSSIGYSEYRAEVSPEDIKHPVTIRCASSPVNLGVFTVMPPRTNSLSEISIAASEVNSVASRSVVMTNATAAVQHPQIAKIGSAHSSQIRINGSSPSFHLNGIAIGTDPNHFGMFSVVPAPIVDRIDFHPQGTDASFGQPSVINFVTASQFTQAASTQLSFSTIEITGTVRRSTENRYIIAAVRKSILDHLVNGLKISSDRQTIPPTSFGDVFASTGVKASSHWQFGLDQYLSADHLNYHVSPTAGRSAMETYQKTREQYLGLRINGVYRHTMLSGTLAMRSGSRMYRATPTAGQTAESFFTDLHETVTSYLGRLDARFEFSGWRCKLGSQLDLLPNRQVSLSHQHWNFLNPFATSDNPFIYQHALNELYGNYEGYLEQSALATHLSIGHTLGPVTVTGGLRSERYGHLAENALLGRLALAVQAGPSDALEISFGTFAEDPVAAVLEPYQVLIRDQAEALAPIKTRLLALDYQHGPAKLSLFHKQLTHLPVIAPDFTAPYFYWGEVSPRVIRMRSEGTAQFVGGSVALDVKNFLSPSIDLYGSYAYTQATRSEHGVTVEYDASARHRITSQLEYRASRKVTLGSEVQIRSGYRYSPTRPVLSYSEPTVYSSEYYDRMLRSENSLQFAPSASLNLYATVTFGDAELNLAVTNVSNRYNPIIHSSSGFVYDAGILPSIGLRWNL